MSTTDQCHFRQDAAAAAVVLSEWLSRCDDRSPATKPVSTEEPVRLALICYRSKSTRWLTSQIPPPLILIQEPRSWACRATPRTVIGPLVKQSWPRFTTNAVGNGQYWPVIVPSEWLTMRNPSYWPVLCFIGAPVLLLRQYSALYTGNMWSAWSNTKRNHSKFYANANNIRAMRKEGLDEVRNNEIFEGGQWRH